MAPSDANSPLSFSPGGTLAEAILIDLSSPHASLASVAAKHHIPLATLSLWLTRPETQALLHAIESGGYTHTRLAASLNLSAAVPVLLQILTDFRTLSQSTTDPTDPAYQRASVSARKAAWMLLRLARSHPLTPAQRSAARDTLGATRAAAAPPHAPAPLAPSLLAPSLERPPAPVAVPVAAPAPAPTLAPTPTQTAAVLDTQSPRDIQTHASAQPQFDPQPDHQPEPGPEPQPDHQPQPQPEPQPRAESEPSEPALHEAPSLAAPSAGEDAATPHDLHDPHAHLVLSDLVAHLSSIAESLGIDISDLDEIADTMAHHATGPPS